MWEGFITLGEAAGMMPRPVNNGTVWRWARDGYTCRDGFTVKLQVRRIGKRLFTRAEWLEGFVTAMNEHDEERVPRRVRKPTYPDQEEAKRKLRETGVI